MRKIDQFTNIYPVSKTLRFKLIPVGKTKENFDRAKMLEVDKTRADNYQKAKKIIDKYYNLFITNCLNNFKFGTRPDNLTKYYKIINDKKMDKDEKNDLIRSLKDSLRKEVVSAFYKKKEIMQSLFNKGLFDYILDDNRIGEEDKLIIKQFDKFTTYFKGFFTNRENIFSDEEKVGSIAYRCINENLEFHIYNMKVYNEIKDKLASDIELLQKEHSERLHNIKVGNIFDIEYFNLCLTGNDINLYNSVIGGFAPNAGSKVKGLNEYINLYNQKNKDSRLPKFKSLYKQILSDDENESFRFDSLNNDEEVYEIIDNLIKNIEDIKCFDTLKDIFNSLKSNKFNVDKIYYSAKEFSALSQKCFSDYSIIGAGINVDYDRTHKVGRNIETYQEKKSADIKKIKFFSLKRIEEYVMNVEFDKSLIVENVGNNALELVDVTVNRISEYKAINKTKSVKENVEAVKNLLDSLLELHKLFECFNCYTPSDEIDLEFYGGLESLSVIKDTVSVYNKVRNYVTKKPYKLDKIKLNFNCPTLLDGWDVNKEKNNLGVLFIKDNNYYLGIIDKDNRKIFDDLENNKSNDSYLKINYKLLPGPNKMLPKVFLSKKGQETFSPSKKLLENYELGTHKKGDRFKRSDMIKLIDYFKDSIKSHEDFSKFEFKFSDTNSYQDLSEFYKEVSDQGYKITYSKISEKYINELVDLGKLYLFKLYNKDFSSYSKGKKNLHTLYYNMCFDESNLKDVVYKLNGEAEIFYREKSIECTITHPKNQPIDNKNANNRKKTSVFSYDLIKDKRFSEDQFEFHIPITINFKSSSNLYNDAVNDSIIKCNDNYIIGIDRGERNLIYINVVSEKKGLVEQISLNDIINNYDGNTYSTNYHGLLEKREKERDAARKSWTSIENIKELKEGYISQVVHKICELVEKYDAIIVMEDLNSGFKNSRIKVEKQVYQKFEKMLIDKLNLYVNKSTDISKFGGLLKPYQLTRPYEGNRKMSFQNGFIFYIAPWNTSKIDPTTGFVNLFRLNNYNTVSKKKEFISMFDNIKYNKSSDVFEFTFNYDNFENGSQDYNKIWTIASYGSRILTFRNKDKNSQYDNKEINLTNELKALFSNNNVEYIDKDLKSEILEVDSKEFFDDLFHYIKLILQMRNSKTGTDIDYLSSPVKNKKDKYYNSSEAKKNGENIPYDADSNGAFNIARKGLMIVERLKNGHEGKGLTVISNKDWLKYAQTHLPI